MKAKARRVLALFLCILMLMGTMITSVSAASDSGDKGGTSIDDVTDILNALSYSEYISKYANVAKGESVIDIPVLEYDSTIEGELEVKNDYYGKDGVLVLPEVGSVTWSFTVPKDALYSIQIEYCQIAGKTNSIERVFYLNGEVPFSGARSVILSKTWKYDYVNGTFKTDVSGNDIRPGISEDPRWVTYSITDSNGYYSYPFEFFIPSGNNTITLEGSRESVAIKSIKLVPYEKPVSYENYLKLYPDNAKDGVVDFVEAENAINISNVTVYPVYDRTSSITSGLQVLSPLRLTDTIPQAEHSGRT